MPAVLKRTVWAKSLGFIVSLAAFVTIILTGQYTEHQMVSWGVLLWYPMVGAMIGLAGVMDKHPLFWKMGIWRGALIAAGMNFVLVLFAAEPLMSVTHIVGFTFTPVSLAWAAVLEWLVVWGAIDWYVTKKFGEGKKLLKK